MLKKVMLATSGFVGAALAGAPASAQSETGIPVGSFRADVTIPVGAAYVTNIFAAPDKPIAGLPANPKVDDVAYTINPRIDLRSQWSNHALDLYADVSHLTYQDHDDQKQTSSRVGGSGRLDITRTFRATVRGSQSWLDEPRTDFGSVAGLLEPVSYETSSAGADISKTFNRIQVGGGYTHTTSDYDDALALDGVTVIDQDDRDVETDATTARIGYSITDRTSVFVLGTSRGLNFEQDPTRDSRATSYALGTSFDITNLIRGEVSFGTLKQDFIDPAASDLDSYSASGTVEWFPTPLITVTLGAQRQVSATGLTGAAGALSTSLTAQVDYAIRRNIVVSGNVGRREDEFNGIDREDEGVTAGLNVLYSMNDHVGASLVIQHTDRDSSGLAQGETFDTQSYGVNLVLRY